jgi:hypothetical protein
MAGCSTQTSRLSQVLAEILPDILNRVDLGTVERRQQQVDVFGIVRAAEGCQPAPSKD